MDFTGTMALLKGKKTKPFPDCTGTVSMVVMLFVLFVAKMFVCSRNVDYRNPSLAEIVVCSWLLS